MDLFLLIQEFYSRSVQISQELGQLRRSELEAIENYGQRCTEAIALKLRSPQGGPNR